MQAIMTFVICLTAFVGATAQAQRTLVPIVSFENIPVSESTNLRLTSDDVKKAFLAAGEEAQWQIVSKGEGVLESTYVKQNKHTVVVTILYDADKYSVRLKSSINMNQRAKQYPGLTKNELVGGESEADRAARVQRERFAGRPDGRYRKADPEGVIHPAYEEWVFNLLDKVRKTLRQVGPSGTAGVSPAAPASSLASGMPTPTTVMPSNAPEARFTGGGPNGDGTASGLPATGNLGSGVPSNAPDASRGSLTTPPKSAASTLKPSAAVPSPQSTIQAGKPPPAQNSTARRLRELNDLFQQGLITESEFTEKRKAILSDL